MILHRHGRTYEVACEVPSYVARAFVVSVTEPEGGTYRTIVDCDVWFDAVEDGAHLPALPLVGVQQINVGYMLMSLPVEARQALAT